MVAALLAMVVAAQELVITPPVRTLVDRMPQPDAADEVTVTVAVAPETTVVGEQLDVVVAAWFPREVRLRLRHPPTLEPPPLTGAWVYHQSVPDSVVLSRRVGDRWYDLYVMHDVAFPLVAGAVRIGPATVSYSLPLSYAFLSRELRHEVRSEALTVTVTPQPAARRPAAFSGAAGTGLRLALEVSGTGLALGDAVPAQLTVTGRGNLALWPEPTVRWPPGLRVYPEGVELRLESADGTVGGSKTFRYLLVADAPGVHHIPPISYGYFDVVTRAYVALSSEAVELVTPGRAGAMLSPRSEAPLLVGGPPLATQVVAALAWWGWLAVALAPPLLILAQRVVPRLGARWASRRHRRRREPVTLSQLAREFSVALERLVPDAALREGQRLVSALRAAGVEAPVASHAARVRDRLRGALFGPPGATDPEELRAEVEEILRVTAGRESRSSSGSPGVIGAIVLLLLVPHVLSAQSAERLYRSGAFRAAADSFAVRATAQPDAPAHWFNLGQARWELGDTIAARAAWVRAARMAPRDPEIRRALARLAPPDPLSRRLTAVAPLTPPELLLIAAGLWLLGWTLAGARVRNRYAVTVLLLALVAAAAAVRTSSRYRTPVALARDHAMPLRAAPYASALVAVRLERGMAVTIERARGAWLLVRRSGARGWVLDREVARL